MRTLVLSALCMLLLPGCPGLIDRDDTPYADFNNALGTTTAVTVRGRMVLEESTTIDGNSATPLRELSQDEIESAQGVSFRMSNTDIPGNFNADEEGYIEAALSLPSGTTPGEHNVDVMYQGKRAGTFRVRLLPPDHTGIVIRSDIDLTYLFTDFMSKTALIELLSMDAQDRTALPAMPDVYRGLRRGADGTSDRPLNFLSGSPKFFKRTLESKCALDGVSQDGLSLKPFKDIVETHLLSDPSSVVPELEEQVGYKLHRLLFLRLEAPPTTQEILMGDDSEADFVIYNLYHRFTSGELDETALLAELDTLGIAPNWRGLIAELAPQVQQHLAGNTPVLAIYINITGSDHSSFNLDDWQLPILYEHQGAWPLILDLREEGWVDEASVTTVKDNLINTHGQSAETLKSASDAAVATGYLGAATVAQFE